MSWQIGLSERELKNLLEKTCEVKPEVKRPDDKKYSEDAIEVGFHIFY